MCGGRGSGQRPWEAKVGRLTLAVAMGKERRRYTQFKRYSDDAWWGQGRHKAQGPGNQEDGIFLMPKHAECSRGDPCGDEARVWVVQAVSEVRLCFQEAAEQTMWSGDRVTDPTRGGTGSHCPEEDTSHPHVHESCPDLLNIGSGSLR